MHVDVIRMLYHPIGIVRFVVQLPIITILQIIQVRLTTTFSIRCQYVRLFVFVLLLHMAAHRW
jgi:hypothetical protein